MFVTGIKGTKFQGDYIFISQGTGCQVHAIEKAIRPLFTDRVTFNKNKNNNSHNINSDV